MYVSATVLGRTHLMAISNLSTGTECQSSMTMLLWKVQTRYRTCCQIGWATDSKKEMSLLGGHVSSPGRNGKLSDGTLPPPTTMSGQGPMELHHQLPALRRRSMGLPSIYMQRVSPRKVRKRLYAQTHIPKRTHSSPITHPLVSCRTNVGIGSPGPLTSVSLLPFQVSGIRSFPKSSTFI